MTYQLGQHYQEQERLERQAELYQDKYYFSLNEGMNVFEFGCGNGVNLWVAESILHGKYIGIDSQPFFIQRAKEKAKAMHLSNAEFHIADATNAPVTDNWSDLSFCRLVLIHNTDPQSILNEMTRVTKPGGMVLAIEPNPLCYIAINKPFLTKTFHARIRYMYQSGKGTLDICPQLFHLFYQAGLANISIKQHFIYCDFKNRETLQLFYKNWIDMLDSMKVELIENQVITLDEYNAAVGEAREIHEGDSIYQCLWIAQGIK